MEKIFAYKFDEGPLDSKEELLGVWNTGNCRRAVQYYIFKLKNIFLKPEEVLCPQAYYETGKFVINEGEVFVAQKLIDGDIIYAEKIRKKDGSLIDKNINSFDNKDDYIVSLHTALFTGKKDKEIWHATAVEGSSCDWSLEKFLYYYKPVAVKRI